MAIPKQTITVLDPGLGLVIPAADSPLYTGVGGGGTGVIGTLYSFSRLNTIRAVLGYSELAEDVSKALQQRGGPVLAMITAGTIAATTSAVTSPSGAGTTKGQITLTGTAKGRYSGKIRCVVGGINGVATFDYSLDAHDETRFTATYSPVRTVPVGGTFVAGNSGLSFVFDDTDTVPGDIPFVAGDVYTFTTEPASANATDLGAAATSLLALPSLLFPLWILSQTQETDETGSAMAAALQGHLTSLANQFRYTRGICDVGSRDSAADVLSEAAEYTAQRICPVYATAYSTVALPYEGYAIRKSGFYSSLAARAARELVSTDLARFASGALEDVVGIDFDGSNDTTLDTAGIATPRTWAGVAGFYITKARLKSSAGSDFTDLHFGRIMDLACRTIYEAQLPFIAEGFMTTDTGAIDPLERADVENAGNSALTDKLLRPKNARGRKGHVSAARYSVDPEHNLNTTGQLLTTVAIRPLGYANELSTQIGFSVNVS